MHDMRFNALQDAEKAEIMSISVAPALSIPPRIQALVDKHITGGYLTQNELQAQDFFYQWNLQRTTESVSRFMSQCDLALAAINNRVRRSMTDGSFTELIDQALSSEFRLIKNAKDEVFIQALSW